MLDSLYCKLKCGLKYWPSVKSSQIMRLHLCTWLSMLCMCVCVCVCISVRPGSNTYFMCIWVFSNTVTKINEPTSIEMIFKQFPIKSILLESNFKYYFQIPGLNRSIFESVYLSILKYFPSVFTNTFQYSTTCLFK